MELGQLNSSDYIIMAMGFAKGAHDGQEYGGRPYYLHPIEVAFEATNLFFGQLSDVGFVAAILHDVVEDTDKTLDDIEDMFGVYVRNTVELLTKDETLTYAENIQRIADSGDRDAIMVKIADNIVNLRNNPKEHNIAKYQKSIETLKKALGTKYTN